MIKQIHRVVMTMVETDSSPHPIFRRYIGGIWECLIGNQWHKIEDSTILEADYQQYMATTKWYEEVIQ
jgi:hypothetical protein